MLTESDFHNAVTQCANEGHSLLMRSCGAITRLYLYGKAGAFILAPDKPGDEWELVTPEESGAYGKNLDQLRSWVLKQARYFPFYAEVTQ
jgi:hypothetical protein